MFMSARRWCARGAKFGRPARGSKNRRAYGAGKKTIASCWLGPTHRDGVDPPRARAYVQVPRITSGCTARRRFRITSSSSSSSSSPSSSSSASSSLDRWMVLHHEAHVDQQLVAQHARALGQRDGQVPRAEQRLEAPAHRQALVHVVRGVEDHKHRPRTSHRHRPGPRPEGQRRWRSPTTTTIDDDGGWACTRGTSPATARRWRCHRWRAAPWPCRGASRDCARVQPAARRDAARV